MKPLSLPKFIVILRGLLRMPAPRAEDGRFLILDRMWKFRCDPNKRTIIFVMGPPQETEFRERGIAYHVTLFQDHWDASGMFHVTAENLNGEPLCSSYFFFPQKDLHWMPEPWLRHNFKRPSCEALDYDFRLGIDSEEHAAQFCFMLRRSLHLLQTASSGEVPRHLRRKSPAAGTARSRPGTQRRRMTGTLSTPPSRLRRSLSRSRG